MAKFGKTDSRYWQDRVFLPEYTRDGERRASRHYAVRIHFRGERESFSLYTGNKAAAAAKARDIYTALVTEGWAATRERFKRAEPRVHNGVITVADLFQRIRETHSGRPGTLEEYFSAFRLIVAESFGIDGAKEKYDYQSGSCAKWRERVEEVRLAGVTPERVQRWKVVFLKRAGTDPVKLRTARTSVNSILRRHLGLGDSGSFSGFRKAKGLPVEMPYRLKPAEPHKYARWSDASNAKGQSEPPSHYERSQAWRNSFREMPVWVKAVRKVEPLMVRWWGRVSGVRLPSASSRLSET
jgi:hypothetical protein